MKGEVTMNIRYIVTHPKNKISNSVLSYILSNNR